MESIDNNSKLDNKDFDITVKISPDYLSATLTVEMYSEDCSIKISDLENALSKKNVSFGVDKNILEKIVADPGIAKEIVVAKGVPFIHGEDGKIEYKFNKETSLKPTINEDGTVDFKNTDFFIPAKRGQILATKTLPTEGKNGTLVTGKIMKGKNGKIVNFKVGKNVFISDDNLSVISSVDGSIKFEYDTISVINTLDIKGDVGIETGNIVFSGKINISGNVCTGFSVKSNDDIVIGGLVEGAVIETDGNLTIKRGVQGADQAFLKVGGDLVTKFISSCRVICSGNIEADAITHSNVSSDNYIKIFGKRGVIVGGDVYGRRGVEAKQIGTDMGTKTFIRVGADSEMYKEYQELQDMREQVVLSLKKIEQVLDLLNKQTSAANSQINSELLDKTLKSGEDYENRLKDLEKSIKDYTILLDELKSADIKTGDIYSGVRLKLGSSFYSVKERTLQTKFVKLEGEISILPWSNYS